MGKGQHAVVPLTTTVEALAGALPAPPPPPPDPVLPPVPQQDPVTKHFVRGNKLGRLRAIKNRARGISSLSPDAVPSFMRGDVEDGVAYAGQMLRLLEDRPVLLPLAGLVADSYTVGKALMKEALKAMRDPAKSGMTMKEILALMSTSKAWLDGHDRKLDLLTKLRSAATLPDGGLSRLQEKLGTGTEGETPAEAPAIEAEGVAVEEPPVELSGMEELRRQIRDVSPAAPAVVPDPPPTDPALPEERP